MALITIGNAVSYQPPNGPITESAYWQDKLAQAEQIVKQLCGRNLESAIYTDKGYTLKIETPADVVYAFYLTEPTGSAIAYGSFTTLTLNGETVAETDVVIEENRLLFEIPGKVVVTYTGGYSTTPAVIRQIVIHVMLILHEQQQGAGIGNRSAAGESQNYVHGPDAFASVKPLLASYRRVFFGGVLSAPHPDD